MDPCKPGEAEPERLSERVQVHLESTRLLPRGRRLLVALSGGRDSVVLLDLLLQLRPGWDWQVAAAHFDHRMRAGSQADADWVRAHCERLDIACTLGAAERVPGSEAEARDLRYEFLVRARDAAGSELLVTAHHADDQAETVLFRILRGTGVAGLAGIPARRAPGIVRPLLPFWRAELETYAERRGLDYRVDPTNRNLQIARNRIRQQLIPEIESKHAPDFRLHLHRLATQARRTARAVDRFAEEAAERLILEAANDRIVVARGGFQAYDREARAHLLRHLVARIGPRPGRVGTRTALEFIRAGSSGRQIDLSGGIVLRREFDRIVLERAQPTSEDRPLWVQAATDGAGSARIAGAGWRVRWGPRSMEAAPGERVAGFDLHGLRLPIAVRSWQPGDRIHLPAGRRKLKKLFVDRRIGRGDRPGYPVVADREGVLWIAGLVLGVRATPREGGDVFTIALRRED